MAEQIIIISSSSSSSSKQREREREREERDSNEQRASGTVTQLRGRVKAGSTSDSQSFDHFDGDQNAFIARSRIAPPPLPPSARAARARGEKF